MRFMGLSAGLGMALGALTVNAGPDPDQAPGFSDELQQSQVIVRPSRSGKVQEYRVAGQPYMVKITPDKGPPYYLVDNDGDGSFETYRSELSRDFSVPQWIIKSWR